jgi:hypothetical protein
MTDESNALQLNESAIRRINRIERILTRQKLSAQQRCCCVALCNAIETQVEIGTPCLAAVSQMLQALVSYAVFCGVDVDATGIAPALKRFLDHLEAPARHAGRRSTR